MKQERWSLWRLLFGVGELPPNSLLLHLAADPWSLEPLQNDEDQVVVGWFSFNIVHFLRILSPTIE